MAGTSVSSSLRELCLVTTAVFDQRKLRGLEQENSVSSRLLCSIVKGGARKNGTRWLTFAALLTHVTHRLARVNCTKDGADTQHQSDGSLRYVRHLMLLFRRLNVKGVAAALTTHHSLITTNGL